MLHPDSTCTAVAALAVEIARPSAGQLRLRYEVDGVIGALKLPQATLPQRSDGLWRTTCFEAFLRDGTGPGYYEFNFSPSRAWAAYRFSAYREGMSPAEMASPVLAVDAGANRLVFETTLALPAGTDWRLGLSAVIEERGGDLSYWALAHPPGKPDFHHADCFALVLPAP